MNGATVQAAQAALPMPPAPRVYGVPWSFFVIFAAVVVVATYLGKLPGGMIGAFPLMIVLGVVFNMAGERAPIINTFLGGGAIVVIFGSAALGTYGLLPAKSVETMTTFMKGGGFLDFYIASLITGSIMGMSRKLLIKAALRYLPVVLGGVALTGGVGGPLNALVGALILKTIAALMFFSGVPPLAQPFFEGIILAGAIALGALGALRAKNRLRVFDL